MAREFSRAFYKSKQWQQARAHIFLRAQGLCEKCGQPGEEVHHIIHLSEQNINDESITLNPENLALLCRGCHQAEHFSDKSKGHKKDQAKAKLADEMSQRYTFDANGQVVPIG